MTLRFGDQNLFPRSPAVPPFEWPHFDQTASNGWPFSDNKDPPENDNGESDRTDDHQLKVVLLLVGGLLLGDEPALALKGRFRPAHRRGRILGVNEGRAEQRCDQYWKLDVSHQRLRVRIV